ncbi:hypothetical protein RIF23_08155 [Lipingzhangella sp. LS1_29]|uniref:NERD domain-containing protein n=1 Tax=Lipingzhangella rawalii TaxID=2055835 RepID=A0ABU2H5Y2_9ACTN|nr:hypothetical protein [Lipingzhangella rawalii]MDS1270264.1 hypothetical protein [Lipingzhangella rawalii]
MRDGGEAEAGPVRPGDVPPTPEAYASRLALFAVRAVVVAAAGVMAGGFLGLDAGVLVAALLTLSYVLLATLGPHVPVPWGLGRWLRRLQRHGYHVLPEGPSEYLVIGPGGVFVLETRAWRNPVSWTGTEWLIGEIPARKRVDRVCRHAVRVGRALGLADVRPDVSVVPVVLVGRRLPQPAVRAGEALIARPRAAIRQIVDAPPVLESDEVVSLVTAQKA